MASKEPQGTPIHASVQRFYAERSQAGPVSCCESGPQSYPMDEIDALPADVASFSLGCGNPIDLANLQPGEAVLDLGSGGGLDCFLASQVVGPSGRVIGVDMTPEMITRAREAATRIGADNVDFRLGMIEDLPVMDASMDVVISNCVINLAPDKDAVFREIFRVLKPGGRLAVSDIVTRARRPDLSAGGTEAWNACLAGAIPLTDYQAGLERAGFEALHAYQPPGISDQGGDQPFSAGITARKPG